VPELVRSQENWQESHEGVSRWLAACTGFWLGILRTVFTIISTIAFFLNLFQFPHLTEAFIVSFLGLATRVHAPMAGWTCERNGGGGRGAEQSGCVAS
jgi:hypothetical protein